MYVCLSNAEGRKLEIYFGAAILHMHLISPPDFEARVQNHIHFLHTDSHQKNPPKSPTSPPSRREKIKSMNINKRKPNPLLSYLLHIKKNYLEIGTTYLIGHF